MLRPSSDVSCQTWELTQNFNPNNLTINNLPLWNKGFGEKVAWATEFDMEHLKKAKGRIGQNVVNITMKIKTIVWWL